jgi:lipopolysaccharide export system protein LptA
MRLSRKYLAPSRTRKFWAVAAMMLISYSGAYAEKADREKPINLEADKVTLDDNQRISVFEGNVILTQGTTKITANKITVRQDKQGNQNATAIGKPATFRTKRDGVDEYVDGSAERVEYDAKTDKVELFTNAWLRRDKDEVRGNYVSYEGTTEFYQALGGGTPNASSATPGRVTVVMQPRPKAAADAPKTAGTPTSKE